MSTTRHQFAAEHYNERATDYVTSAVHSSGADLEQIEAAMRGRDTARVLDLGCGGGHVSYCTAPHVAEVVACDPTPSMLEAVSATAAARGLANIRVQLAAAEHLPFPDASFDAVLCRFTAHHWHDMEAGLRQARRVLKPGGAGWFIDPLASADRFFDTHLQTIEMLRDPSHVRNYSVAEWVAALSRAGFAIEDITMRVLRMEFPVRNARTRTPPVHEAAIRALQQGGPAGLHEHFAIGEDGSFNLETATFGVRAT
jgi:ubiquinone/menaquinone biosynthesis C-methylase UbiE